MARGASVARRSYRRAVTTTAPTTDLLARLGAVLPADRLVTDADVLASYAHDEAEWAEYALPACVVRPRTAEEVQAVVRACIEFRTPLVPRGAGTGLSGGANAVAGCVVLSLERMDAVLEVDELERLAVVQPGVVNDALRAYVASYGLWYPPDPASSPWSTIGGNVATNAGGVCGTAPTSVDPLVGWSVQPESLTSRESPSRR